jgi:ankyrin repeat protein
MKKTVIISACLIGLSLATLNASVNTMPYHAANKVELKVKINSFCVAAIKGDLQTVKKLVEYGEEVNQISNGMTPLMYAAKYNRIEVVKFLLAEGADPNAKSDKGFTALEYAEQTGARDVVSVLTQL